MDKSSQTLLVIFVAVAAISILMQAAFTVAMFFAFRKAQKKMMTLADDVRLHALPVIMSSRELIQNVTPQLKHITENLTATTTTLRAKTEQIGGLVDNVTERAEVQASRVDGMLKGTLDQLTHAVQAIEHGVAVPVRQVNGILNGLRAGMDVMMRKTPNSHLDPDNDLFV
jgi:methyl-accepting chemotaxis protein